MVCDIQISFIVKYLENDEVLKAIKHFIVPRLNKKKATLVYFIYFMFPYDLKYKKNKNK